MAVQQWELVEQERPRALRLVQTASAPPRGRPVGAALFVIFVVLAVGAPSIAAALQRKPEPQRWVARPQPATALASLDALDAVPRVARPVSREPFAGMLFVRCTRLWAALPDGSHPRKVLEMPGISSPALAPNARTLAFFVQTPAGQELWMAGADGSGARRIGSLTSGGADILLRASALTWSPRGDGLAFALTDGRYGEFEGGSAIWTFDLESGSFARRGSGFPAPFWAEGQLAWAAMGDKGWAQLTAPRDLGNWMVRNVRTSKHDLSAALVPSGYSTNHRRGAAILRTAGDRPLLVVKDSWRRGLRDADLRVEAPEGFAFAEHARPAISQDGSSVAIELVDREGGSDLGVLDTSRGEWSVLDYAWDPAASPAPIVTGPLGARRAQLAVRDLFDAWGSAGTRRNLVVAPEDRSAFPFEGQSRGYIAGDPVRAGKAWTVPVTVYGSRGEQQWWRSAVISVSTERARLTVDVSDLGPLGRLSTVADALAFVESALGREVAPPPLPADTGIRQGGLWAYSYSGDRHIQFSVMGARGTARRGQRSTLTFGYGNGLDFSMGCGGEVDPQPIDLGATPAVADSSAGAHQVIWPATMENRNGTHSVYGYGFERSELIEIARTMASTP